MLVQEHGLRIVSGVANRTASSACDMDRQERFGLRHLEQCKPITEVEGQSIGNGTNEQCRSFTHVPSPTSTSLAQSMVSAPMVRASPGAWSQNRLWSFQSNSFECMRYGSASVLPHMRSGPELDVLKPGPKVLFFASLGKLSEQPAFVMIGKWCLDCPTT